MTSVINFGLLTEVIVTLFVIMDPPGTVPVFISLTAGQSRAVRKKAAWQAVLVAFDPAPTPPGTGSPARFPN